MNTDNLIKKMKYADTWTKIDFAKLLAAYNLQIGNYFDFDEWIFKSVSTQKLTPINPSYNLSVNPRDRNFEFMPQKLIDWAKYKGFFIPPELTSQNHQIQNIVSSKTKKNDSIQADLSTDIFLSGYSKRPDCVAEIIYAATDNYIKAYKDYPTELQIWQSLMNSPPQGFKVEYRSDSMIIERKKLDKPLFKKRWRRFVNPEYLKNVAD